MRLSVSLSPRTSSQSANLEQSDAISASGLEFEKYNDPSEEACSSLLKISPYCIFSRGQCSTCIYTETWKNLLVSLEACVQWICERYSSDGVLLRREWRSELDEGLMHGDIR